MNESSSESYVHVLCSIARTHSRATSAVIFLLTTGGVVYLLLRQVLSNQYQYLTNDGDIHMI